MTEKGDSTLVEEVFSIGSTVMLNKRAAKLTAYDRMALLEEQGAIFKKSKTGVKNFPAQYVPLPIWAQVASRMKITEWARVCRTCTVTNGVQPDVIDIQQHYAPTGTKWLSKRWGGATVLRISDAGESTAKDLARDARAVSSEKLFLRLTQLLIRPELLEDATEDAELLSSNIDSQPEPSTDDTVKRTWTDEVLARAQKLTVLAACMYTAPLVNHLQHLKHLVLCCGDFHAAFAVLPQAVSLETLCLGTLRRQQLEIDWSYSFPSVDYHHEPLALPCLMLEALPHLRSVALRDVRPQQLQLPVGCELHLSGWECWELNGELAPDLLACWPLEAVRSLQVMGLWPTVTSTATFAAAFSRFHALERVDLKLACPIGRADAPALLHLDHVLELSIRCDALHIRVPAEVAWRALVLSAPHGAVTLAFDDVQKFAAKVPEMSVCFGAPGGIWGFTQLEAALQACGTGFEHKPVDGDVPGTFVVAAEGCGGSERRLLKCGCKACLPCLTAAGVVAAK